MVLMWCHCIAGVSSHVHAACFFSVSCYCFDVCTYNTNTILHSRIQLLCVRTFIFSYYIGIVYYWWKNTWTYIQLVFNWYTTGIQLLFNWYTTGIQLVYNWYTTGMNANNIMIVTHAHNRNTYWLLLNKYWPL